MNIHQAQVAYQQRTYPLANVHVSYIFNPTQQRHWLLAESPWLQGEVQYIASDFQWHSRYLDSLLLGGRVPLPFLYAYLTIDSLPRLVEDLTGWQLPQGGLVRLKVDSVNNDLLIDIPAIYNSLQSLQVNGLWLTATRRDTTVYARLMTDDIISGELVHLTQFRTEWQARNGQGQLRIHLHPEGYYPFYFQGQLVREPTFYRVGIDSLSFWYAGQWWLGLPSYCFAPEGQKWCLPDGWIRNREGNRYIRWQYIAPQWHIQAQDFPLDPLLALAQPYLGYAFSADLSAQVQYHPQQQHVQADALVLKDLMMDTFALGTWQWQGHWRAHDLALTWSIDQQQTLAIQGDPTRRLSLDIDHLPLRLVQPFTIGIIDSLDGYLATREPLILKVGEHPDLRGEIKVRQARLHVDFTGVTSMLQARFRHGVIAWALCSCSPTPKAIWAN